MTTALIAEDEPLLAQALGHELRQLWPALQQLDVAPDGERAVELALALRPDVLFLDIRMPGMTGLDAAQAVIEDWPDDTPLPLIVFVTAYDQYALEAFDRAAIDYVLKPVQTARLAQTCERLQAALGSRQQSAASRDAPDDVLTQLRALLGGHAAPGDAPRGAPTPPLRVIQAGAGNTLHMVPVGEVLYFEAADKYVRVVTAQREHLIRTSLRELLPQLDTDLFWQVHRGTVVRADAIAQVTRDDAGKLHLALAGRPERLIVSRLYAGRFKAM